MPSPAYDVKPLPRSPGWANRILLAAIACILFLTLYPFRFSLHAHAPLSSSPFLLGRGVKRTSVLDFALNVLLFVPFGFGLSSKLRQRNGPRAGYVVIAALAGAAFSYAIEFVQIFIPMRDSGWEDIFSNSAGSLLGALVFAGVGSLILHQLSNAEDHLESWLTAGRTLFLLLAYFSAWFAVSIPMQKQTSLKNWEPNSFLLVGNDGSLTNPWQGEVLRFQIWDHAIPDPGFQVLTSRELNSSLSSTPLADYDFSLPAPVPDQQGSLPALTWSSRVPQGKRTGHPSIIGTTWLMSQSAVTGLTSALQKTNQFTIRVVCQSFQIAGGEGAIASIAQPLGKENLIVWQEGTSLAFWFRNPLTTNTYRLRWSVSDVFLGDQARDILISYDGSNLSFFRDGKKERRSTQLGPGVGLAKLFHRGKPGEVQIYNDIFYLAVFFPAGCLLGIGTRKIAARHLLGPLLLGFLIAPLGLEMILAYVSGRSHSLSDVAQSCILAAVAALWINSDRLFTRNP